MLFMLYSTIWPTELITVLSAKEMCEVVRPHPFDGYGMPTTSFLESSLEL